MATLRSTGGRPLVAGAGGRPLLDGGPNVAAPAVVTPSAGLLFDPVARKPGVPLVNDQFENFAAARDFAYNYNHPTDGFAGIRIQPTVLRADGFFGSWEPMEAEIFRIQRKGASGQDARTLVFTCGPNPATVPVGDKVVVWEVPGWDGGVVQSSAFNLSGYSLPLRQKMTVTGGAGSATYDPDGRRTIEVDAGTALPAIDFAVGNFNANWYNAQNMRLRHWSYLKSSVTKEMRHPMGWFKDIARNGVLANGGFMMLGGMQGIPTWSDWTVQYRNFGASLTEELWRQECEGLAYHFGDTDPRYLAVELENEPTQAWRGNSTDGPGYGDLLPDVWYGIARQVWGKDRTLVVKATDFGGINSLISEWDWTCPTGDLSALVTHNYPGQARMQGNAGGFTLNFGDVGQTDWYAGVVADKIKQFGFKNGGMTELGAGSSEWWDWAIPVSLEERGRRHGRMLTSLTKKSLYMFAWGATGDDYRCVDIYDIGGHRVEGYWRDLAPFCRRSGLTTT